MEKLPSWFYAAILVFIIGCVVIVTRMLQEGQIYLAGGSLVVIGMLFSIMAIGNYLKNA